MQKSSLLLFIIIVTSFQRYYLPYEKGTHAEQIPVLCYHNIKEKPVKENSLFISKMHLEQQIKFLFDKGYHTISPGQLYGHFTLGDTLPPNPVIICFDDAHEEHYSIAKPILEKYGFRGVFFVFTICINKPNYLTSEQIKELCDNGHTIGLHTWDHPYITTLKERNWDLEIDNPKRLLEKITCKQIESFAYPFGVWNESAIAELKNRGIKTAFQLSGKQSTKEPLMTLRRIMVSGSWSLNGLEKNMSSSFP